jgi:hypothetical protein
MATRRSVHTTLAAAALLVLLTGCSGKKADTPYVFMLSDFLDAKELPYDSPPQVIYRIDDHRFVTLERYRDCYYGDTWYNDTRTGIRQLLGRAGIEDYQGKVINADPTGMNLVFPSAAPPNMAAIDRGWSVELMYSTDGGKTFSPKDYMDHSFDPFNDSKNYIVAATRDKLFVAQKYQYRSDMPGYDLIVTQYPLNPHVDLNRAYPPGFDDEIARASKRKLMPDDLRTPSGENQIHCDASIKPSNPDAPLQSDVQ